jgi:hypothetical protein
MICIQTCFGVGVGVGVGFGVGVSMGLTSNNQHHGSNVIRCVVAKDKEHGVSSAGGSAAAA